MFVFTLCLLPPACKLHKGRDLGLLCSLMHSKYLEFNKYLLNEQPDWQGNSEHEPEQKYPCFLEIPPKDRRKEKFCIQISQNPLLINSS